MAIGLPEPPEGQVLARASRGAWSCPSFSRGMALPELLQGLGDLRVCSRETNGFLACLAAVRGATILASAGRSFVEKFRRADYRGFWRSVLRWNL